MGHVYIQRKRNKKNFKIIQGHQIKITFGTQNTIQNIVKKHPPKTNTMTAASTK
jgi:hypothetical protein